MYHFYRIFAFSQNLDLEKSKLFENNPDERKGKWNKILTLKNTPVLNKYNFLHQENKLTLMHNKKEIISINVDDVQERKNLTEKLIFIEKSRVLKH